jgi:hypothetical protein
MLLAALTAAAGAVAQERRINVSGYGMVEAEPDMARFRFSIEGQTDTPALATERADAIAGDLVRRLERIGIESRDIRSSPVSMFPFTDVQSRRELIRFNRETTVVVRDLDDVEAVNTAALEAGVNSIGQAEYSVSNLEELQNQARDLALEDARQQAQGAAGALGVRIGRVVTISVSRPQPIPPRPLLQAFRTADAAEAAPDYRPGRIEITAGADVAFEIVDP